jgi:hypothetical protein
MVEGEETQIKGLIKEANVKIKNKIERKLHKKE